MTALARALIDSGRLPADAVERCLNRATQRQCSLADELVQAGLISGEALAEFASQTFGFPRVNAATLGTTQPIQGLSHALYTDSRFLPLELRDRQLSLAMSDPTDESLIHLARFQSGCSVVPMVADCQTLAAAHAVLALGNTSDLVASTTPAIDDNPLNVDDAPAVRFLQRTLSDAVASDASDIHFEPYEHSYRIRFRIDGLLQDAPTPSSDIRSLLASRLKVLSRLNIAEKRLPQDGQMRIDTLEGDPVDFRISTMPTLYGEKIVLRILDRQSARRQLDQLGMPTQQMETLQRAIHQPSGMILVTGPTGSGKTVSLYACLNALNQPGVNIATAEDPVEIPVDGINQVNIDDRIGLTFATTLRAFMRQDPDILMVGEIRDFETADIAVKAAQTGHLVLSTLHTRSAPASLERLRQLGLPAFNVAGSVLLIMAQRLIRRLCTCKSVVSNPDLAGLREAGFNESQLADLQADRWQLFTPQGCSQCRQSGYRGRLAIFEVLPVSPAIQDIILNGGSTMAIAAQAQQEGVMDLRQAGLEKVIAGETSITEVLAATERSFGNV